MSVWRGSGRDRRRSVITERLLGSAPPHKRSGRSGSFRPGWQRGSDSHRAQGRGRAGGTQPHIQSCFPTTLPRREPVPFHSLTCPGCLSCLSSLQAGPQPVGGKACHVQQGVLRARLGLAWSFGGAGRRAGGSGRRLHQHGQVGDMRKTCEEEKCEHLTPTRKLAWASAWAQSRLSSAVNWGW